MKEVPKKIPTKSIGDSSALNIARLLKNMRLAQNITQKEMALRVGISERSYQIFEQRGEIRLMKFLEILRVFGILGGVSDSIKNLSAPQTAKEAITLSMRRERARKNKYS